MVEWIATRVGEGVDPRRILAIMFNTNAKREFDQRLKARLGRSLPVATFNAVGKRYHDALMHSGRLPRRELIVRDTDVARFAKMALVPSFRAQHGEKSFPSKEQLAAFSTFLTLARAHLRPPADVFAEYGYAREMRCFVEAVDAFEQILSEEGRMTFDDQVLQPVRLAQVDPAAWHAIAPEYDWVVVDEAQDASETNIALLRALLVRGGAPLLVGDPDQTIYRFRGARPDYIERDFAREYTPVIHYSLSRTFRFGHRIGLMATLLLNSGRKRHQPKLVIADDSTPDTSVQLHAQRVGQGRSPLLSILGPAAARHELSDHAILVRFHAHTLPVELELRLAGIPYHVYDRKTLASMPVVMAMFAVLCIAGSRLPPDPDQRQLLWRALLIVPTLYLRSADLDAFTCSFDNAFASGRCDTSILLAAARGARNQDASLRLLRRAKAIEALFELDTAQVTSLQLLERFLEDCDFRADIQRHASTPEQGREHAAYLEAVLRAASTRPDLHTMLDDLDAILESVGSEPPDVDHVAIRTIHSVKGDEFHTVILPAWAEGEFPREQDTIEDERRLAYVAMTRARHALHILHPADDLLEEEQVAATSSAYPPVMPTASRFLFEAEAPAALRIAGAIEAGRTPQAQVRNIEAANAYLAAVGATDHRVAKSRPSLAPASAHQPPASGVPAPPARRPVVHPVPLRTKVHSDARGTFTVHSHLADGRYRLVPLTGVRLIDSALEPSEWTLIDDSPQSISQMTR